MKHLLSSRQLEVHQVLEILDIAEGMNDVNARDIKKLPTLRGKTVVNLFYEDSTRTRISFELAAKRLSADVINFSAKGSSVSKGESLRDTAQTLEAMGADAVVMRHPASGAAEVLARSGWIGGSVINAGDGTHEHPTQALLDAFTIRKHFHGLASLGKTLAGLKILIVGDILHSRVAKSAISTFSALGANVACVAPPTLMFSNHDSFASEMNFSLADSLESFKPDVVMMLRIQSERMDDSFFPSVREYSKIWGLTAEKFARLSPKAVVMHPGPMIRGLEIDSSVAESSQSLILQQVSNGVSVRMAVLFKLLSGESSNV